MAKLYVIFFCFFSTTIFAAHIRGQLTAIEGETLAFANVYVKGTSMGTTTNVDGFYDLVLEAGNYELVFQYMGYETKIEKITLEKEDIVLDIILKPITNKLQEVVITAGEDPAYRVIRKAIKRRKFHQKKLQAYSCDSYVKGRYSVSTGELPKSFMGFSLESDSSESMDSTDLGIIYLSESLSRLHYQSGKYKEIMTSSKVSGDDNGFSFNSGAALAKMSFYDNVITLEGAQVLSPIATGALTAYKYRMETSFYDENGRLIYKIEVLPKNKLGATFGGYIYIVDQDWAIHSTDLFVTGKATNISILDTIYFRETHLKLENEAWGVFSKNLTFKLKVLFMHLNCYFTSAFSNYDLKPNFDRRFFNAEIFKIEDKANKQEEEHWDSIRPVPLSEDEIVEYHEGDSLQKIWNSKEYQDSIDRLTNQFTLIKLLKGYTYRNSRQRYSITIPSPFKSISYNTVQGYTIGLGIDFNKTLNREKHHWLKIHLDGEYSFSDRQLRGGGMIKMYFNSITNATLEAEGGRYVKQFNSKKPISKMLNAAYSLWGRLNYLKLYDAYYGNVAYSQELVNGLYFKGAIKYAQRVALTNTSDHSWVSKNSNAYFSNHPKDLGKPKPFKDTPSFLTHEHLEISLALRIRFGQKYITYPHRRVYKKGKFPDIWIRYKRGIPILGGDTNYDYLELAIEKENIVLGTSGVFSFKVTGGWFPYRQKTFFMDYHHFNGNQTFVANTKAYLSTFQLLPYYEYSTNTAFVMLHAEHNFNGAIWNKIPGLKMLGFQFVAGYHMLYTPEKGDYQEFTIGLDRIGWALFRVLRVDFVLGYKVGEPLRPGAVVGLTFSL